MALSQNHYWYVLHGGVHVGPISLAELREGILNQTVAMDARFRRADTESYRPGVEHPELVDLFTEHGVLTTHPATPRAKKK